MFIERNMAGYTVDIFTMRTCGVVGLLAPNNQ